MQLSECIIYFFHFYFIWTPESRCPIVVIVINLTSIIIYPVCLSLQFTHNQSSTVFGPIPFCSCYVTFDKN